MGATGVDNKKCVITRSTYDEDGGRSKRANHRESFCAGAKRREAPWRAAVGLGEGSGAQSLDNASATVLNSLG